MNIKQIFYGAIVFVLLMTFASSAFAYDAVLLNTNDWKEQYLGTVLAAREGADVYTFGSLSDLQIKMKTIPEDAEIVVLEPSSNFVIKNMQKYLTTQGFSSVQAITYGNYVSLQKELFSYDSKILVLHTTFGSEAISTFLLTTNDDYDPFFVSEESLSDLQSIGTSDKSILLIGHYPIWLKQKLPAADTTYDSYEEENIEAFISTVASDYDWGLMMEPGNVDLEALKESNPVFLFTGDPERYSDLIEASGIVNYEVIGGDLVNLASGVEQQVGYDLRLLVKYARTVTGIDSLRGQLLDVDAVSFPFPFSFLESRSAKYYSNDGVLTVLYANTGTVDIYFSSTIEAGSSIVSTDRLYMIRAGTTLEIPFNVSEPVGEVVVNTQYGRDFPLTQTVVDNEGFPLVTLPVVDSKAVSAEPLEINSLYLSEKGILHAQVTNPNSVEVNYAVQVYVNMSEEALPLSSPLTVFSAGETKEVLIDASYTEPELLKEVTLESVSHYGPSAQWYTSASGVYVDKPPADMAIALYGGIAVVVLLLIGIIIFFMFRKK